MIEPQNEMYCPLSYDAENPSQPKVCPGQCFQSLSTISKTLVEDFTNAIGLGNAIVTAIRSIELSPEQQIAAEAKLIEIAEIIEFGIIPSALNDLSLFEKCQNVTEGLNS